MINGRAIRLSATIGVASSAAANTPEELLTHADMAMYQAKTTLRGTVGHFDNELRRQTQKRVELEQRLKRAVPSMEDFTLAYQPLMTIDSGALFGYEALLRWSDPTLGPVSPALFVPIAEEADMIIEIDRWVLREAVAEAAVWAEHGASTPQLSVNVSPAAFTRPDFVNFVAETLATHGVPARRLSLEITERAMLSDVDWSAAVVERLRRLGARVVLDDFGTGYSSLSYLRHFPVDGIKIDRSFITDIAEPEARALVEAIIFMASTLGAQAVAEGVETAEQLRHLRGIGCDIGQGWYWGAAVDAETVRAQIGSAYPTAPQPVAP